MEKIVWEIVRRCSGKYGVQVQYNRVYHVALQKQRSAYHTKNEKKIHSYENRDHQTSYETLGQMRIKSEFKDMDERKNARDELLRDYE